MLKVLKIIRQDFNRSFKSSTIEYFGVLKKTYIEIVGLLKYIFTIFPLLRDIRATMGTNKNLPLIKRINVVYMFKSFANFLAGLSIVSIMVLFWIIGVAVGAVADFIFGVQIDFNIVMKCSIFPWFIYFVIRLIQQARRGGVGQASDPIDTDYQELHGIWMEKHLAKREQEILNADLSKSELNNQEVYAQQFKKPKRKL